METPVVSLSVIHESRRQARRSGRERIKLCAIVSNAVFRRKSLSPNMNPLDVAVETAGFLNLCQQHVAEIERERISDSKVSRCNEILL